jgi:MraZ protein
MFRGNHPTRVDEKGRLKMPAEFRRELMFEQEFYITSMDGKRAQLYPMKEWEKKEDALAKMPSTHPARMRFLDVTSYYGQMATIDQQGRLLLPQLLREEAQLEGDVVVLGKQGALEVVNHAQFKPEAKPLTIDELSALAEFGV